LLSQALPGRISAQDNLGKLDIMFDPIGYLNKELDKKRVKLQSQEYFPTQMSNNP